MDAELVQFPLRMRDWLKNVLLQLYEHDSAASGFLTAKQRFKVTHENTAALETEKTPKVCGKKPVRPFVPVCPAGEENL